MIEPHLKINNSGARPGSVQSLRNSRDVLHLLSVGSIDQHIELHDLLLHLPAIHISAVTNCSNLLEISERDGFQLAILHDSFNSSELDEACRTIRQRWPGARIIVIRAGEEFLEDSLYDVRVLPTAEQQGLLAQIELALHNASSIGAKGIE